MNTTEILTTYSKMIDDNIKLGMDEIEISGLINKQLGDTLSDEEAYALDAKILTMIEKYNEEQAEAELEYMEMMQEQEAYYASSRGCV